MRYSLLSTAVLAFTSSVFAQDATPFFDEFTAPTEGQQLVAGKSFEITWVPGTKPEYLNGTATIVLLQGSTTKDLQVGPLIVAGVNNAGGKYTWAVPADASFALYGLRITLDDDKSTTQKEDTIFQYSFPFQIVKSAQSSGTVTVRLGTGTAFTPEPTTTSTLVRSATNSTSTMTSTSASFTPINSSNATLTTSATRIASSGLASATSTGVVPEVTNNAGAANAVSGGLMLVGGVVLALAL